MALPPSRHETPAPLSHDDAGHAQTTTFGVQMPRASDFGDSNLCFPADGGARCACACDWLREYLSKQAQRGGAIRWTLLTNSETQGSGQEVEPSQDDFRSLGESPIMK